MRKSCPRPNFISHYLKLGPFSYQHGPLRKTVRIDVYLNPRVAPIEANIQFWVCEVEGERAGRISYLDARPFIALHTSSCAFQIMLQLSMWVETNMPSITSSSQVSSRVTFLVRVGGIQGCQGAFPQALRNECDHGADARLIGTRNACSGSPPPIGFF